MFQVGSKVKIFDEYGRCIVSEATVTMVVKETGVVYIRERLNGRALIYGVPFCSAEHIESSPFRPTFTEVVHALKDTFAIGGR